MTHGAEAISMLPLLFGECEAGEGLLMERMPEEARRTTSQIGVVFYVAAALSLTFIVWVVFLPTNFDSVTRAMLGFVVQNLN